MVCDFENRDDARVDRATAPWTDYLGETYYFCGGEHLHAFKEDPAGFFMHTMWGMPEWMYYCSIAMVMLVSFGLFEWMERRWSNSDPS